MKKLLLLILLILLPVLCSAQTVTPTPINKKVWFVAPATQQARFLCGQNFTSKMPYFNGTTITAMDDMYFSDTQVLVRLNINSATTSLLSSTANCTFITIDPAFCPNAMQALVAKNKLTRQVSSMGSQKLAY